MTRKRKSYLKGYRRGDGPRALYLLGGSGGQLSYAGAAADWWVHFALTSVPRLRIVSWLCLNPGEHPSSVVEYELRLKKGRALEPLLGLRSCNLVQGRIASWSKAPRWLWSVTEQGRRYLWRFGWVTGRLVPGIWSEDTYAGRVDAAPWDVLAAEAAPTLLRPVALATAYFLWMHGPTTVGQIVRTLGVTTGATGLRLAIWSRLGWVRHAGGARTAHPRVPGHHRTANLWAFTREGLHALERHCHALRWAAQNSGYIPPHDDRFYLGNDRVNWYTVDFNSDRW